MSKTPVSLPVARHWREIPQEVKPRAMSREGRRRATARGIRITGLAAALALVAAAAWQVSLAWGKGAAPAAAPRGEWIGDHLEAESDGVLNGDKAWLESALALPANATLDSIDLGVLRERLLASGQVQAAALLRHFPRTLTVRMSERTPIARVRVAPSGEPQRTLLVARDGTVYEGHGYDGKMLDTLPWLGGIAAHGGKLGPIDGMESVNELLARAKLYAPALYRDWWILSLDRLASDGVIEVRTREGESFLFGSQSDDFTHQLGRLAFILDQYRSQEPPRRIDLSLGSAVFVSGPATAAVAASRPGEPAPPSSSAQTSFNFDLLFHPS